MNVLLWRGWRPAFNDGLTFTKVYQHACGGTEMQMLWHAQHLAAEGHRVQVLGATLGDVEERGVDFVGAKDRATQEEAVASGRVASPQLILLEGAFDAAAYFKQRFSNAAVVHVGQNIDPHADRAAFAVSQHVDLYAFVGLGHLADYCGRWPRLRHKFTLLRNAVPWQEFHGRIEANSIDDKVIWVGGWTKKGLRLWCEVMAKVLQERPQLRWVLCGPAYGSEPPALPRHLTWGLNMPWNRIECVSLPLESLLHEIATSRAVLVSLGNECGPGSILDAHAMGRPVISGNDMVYKYANPEGTGLRATTFAEARKCLEFLLDTPASCEALGQAGRSFVQAEYHEDRQRCDLVRLVDYIRSGVPFQPVSRIAAFSRWQERGIDLIDKASRWWRRRHAGD